MVELRKIDKRLTAEGKLGPAARLDNTQTACTLRDGLVIDGPFAETKEQLLGLYLVNVETRDEAIQAARDLAGGQSHRRLRNPPDNALPARRPLPGTAG